MNTKYPLIIITGPTATGKSALSIKLAKIIGGEVISADSAQIYRDLSIITARTLPGEMEGVPHHLTGFLELNQDFSLSEFQKTAYRYIAQIHNRGGIPILTGGTGLYIRAVARDYQLADAPPDPDFRRDMELLARRNGPESLYEMLKEKDPRALEKIPMNNLRRIIRALEVIKATGRPFSSFGEGGNNHSLGITPILFCLNYPRDILYERIEKRIDLMMAEGGMDEIEELQKKGMGERLKRLKILGCREILSILEGKFSWEEGIEKFKQNTKMYAKRQITWCRSFQSIKWLDLSGGSADSYAGEIADSFRQVLSGEAPEENRKVMDN